MRYTRFWLTFFGKVLLGTGGVFAAIALVQLLVAPTILEVTLKNLPTTALFIAGFLLFIVQISVMTSYNNLFLSFGCTRREVRHMNLAMRLVYSAVAAGVYLLICASLGKSVMPLPLLYIAVCAGLVIASCVFALIGLTTLIDRKLTTVLSAVMGGILGGGLSFLGLNAAFALQHTPHTTFAVGLLAVTALLAVAGEQAISKWALGKMQVK